MFPYEKHTYKKGLGSRELSPGDLVAARNTQVELIKQGPSAVAGLGLAVGTGAGFKVAHASGAVITPCAKDIGARVSDIGLGKSSDESVGNLVGSFYRLLEEICRETLVVAGDVSVVAQHGRRVDRKPG